MHGRQTDLNAPVVARSHSLPVLTAGLLCAALALGCNDPTGEATGWIRATLTGAVETTFEGAGAFVERNSNNVPAGVQTKNFSLHARGTGSSAEAFILFARPGNTRPGKGRYALGPIEGREGFTAFYHAPTEDGGMRYFATLSGEITIEHSSGGRVRGTFRLTVVLYCALTSAQLHAKEPFSCSGPYDPLDTSAPRLQVTGAFDATPFDPQLSAPTGVAE